MLFAETADRSASPAGLIMSRFRTVISPPSLLQSITKEREIHARVQDLVLCGVRPKVIFRVLDGQMAIKSVKRIYDCISPLRPEQRHGRNMKCESIHKLNAETNALYIECFTLVKKAIALGADRVDALSSAWRIVHDRANLPYHATRHGSSCEEMIVLFLNLEVDDLTIETCGTCGTPFLSAKAYHCTACASKSNLKKLAA